MEEADDVLPLASSHGGKLFHVVRSSFVDSLEACLKSYHSRLTQVNIDHMLEGHVDIIMLLFLTKVVVTHVLYMILREHHFLPFSMYIRVCCNLKFTQVFY